jgi:hypothetical protein
MTRDPLTTWTEAYRRANVPTFCASRHHGWRDWRSATCWLVAPDGKPNPGGTFCADHGREAIRGLRLYGERWRRVTIARGYAMLAVMERA